MKKVIFIVALLRSVIPLNAQRKISFSVELEAGAGVWKGPLFTVSPEFVAQYGFSNGISVGAGAGVRYSMPCLQYITTNGTPRRKFINEMISRSSSVWVIPRICFLQIWTVDMQ